MPKFHARVSSLNKISSSGRRRITILFTRALIFNYTSSYKGPTLYTHIQISVHNTHIFIHNNILLSRSVYLRLFIFAISHRPRSRGYCVVFFLAVFKISINGGGGTSLWNTHTHTHNVGYMSINFFCDVFRKLYWKPTSIPINCWISLAFLKNDAHQECSGKTKLPNSIPLIPRKKSKRFILFRNTKIEKNMLSNYSFYV